MELWFLLALLSTIAGGLASFVYKVAAVHRVDATLLSCFSGFVSASFVLTLFLYNGNFSNLWHPMLIFAALASMTFFATQVIKIKAMDHIDTAIFFPIYKVIGPLGAIVMGLIFFGESFSWLEWVGLLVSLLVPIMLITKSEHLRQNDLIKGLWLVTLAALISAVSISFTKEGVNVAQNIYGYILAGEVLIGVTGVSVLLSRYKFRVGEVIVSKTNTMLLVLSGCLGAMHALGALTLVFAFYYQGPLGIVYTINSLYILIPIILSIIFYNEHWNTRKVVAIILSIAAIGLLQ